MVLCMGDFNTKPTHLAYSIMTKCLRLKDTFEDDPVDTCDLKSNLFTVERMTPKRIDFIFYSNEDSGSCSIKVMVGDGFTSIYTTSAHVLALVSVSVREQTSQFVLQIVWNNYTDVSLDLNPMGGSSEHVKLVF